MLYPDFNHVEAQPEDGHNNHAAALVETHDKQLIPVVSWCQVDIINNKRKLNNRETTTPHSTSTHQHTPLRVCHGEGAPLMESVF